MKKLLLACAACAAIAAAGNAQAVTIPTLTQFLTKCNINSDDCRTQIRGYIKAADDQKLICRPADQSLGDASYEALHWMRDTGASDQTLHDGPYDDAMWAAISTLWPCKSE